MGQPRRRPGRPRRRRSQPRRHLRQPQDGPGRPRRRPGRPRRAPGRFAPIRQFKTPSPEIARRLTRVGILFRRRGSFVEIAPCGVHAVRRACSPPGSMSMTFRASLTPVGLIGGLLIILTWISSRLFGVTLHGAGASISIFNGFGNLQRIVSVIVALGVLGLFYSIEGPIGSLFFRPPQLRGLPGAMPLSVVCWSDLSGTLARRGAVNIS